MILSTMQHIFKPIILFLASMCISTGAFCKTTIIDLTGKIRKGTDITETVSRLMSSMPKKDVRLIFPEGTYYISSELATGKYLTITNHDNGYKNIAFDIDGFSGLEIIGSDTEFIFDGFILPFYLNNSENVSFKGFSVDWKVPFFIQGEVVRTSAEGGFYDLRIFTDGYDWTLSRSGKIDFPSSDPYSSVGESLVFDKDGNKPIYGAKLYDLHRKGSDVRAERTKDGNIRMYENLKNYPPVGSIVNFKGPNGENRYSPAFHAIDSKNITFSDINIYHAPGMGILCEKSSDITLNNVNITVRKGSDRTVSTTADATHFCNCKGNVIIENCVFENMLDDGTNVHGTYVEVAGIVDEKTVRIRMHHPQQRGFAFAGKGDEIYFLIAPSIGHDLIGRVSSIKHINESYSDITFEKPMPTSLSIGDVLENKTWNTSLFRMNNCTIRNNRARNIVIKAPGKVEITNNTLSSMMASILVRNEMAFWYESGPVENLLIENNLFEDCVTAGDNSAVITISPRIGPGFNCSHVDHNIRILNNTFKTFGSSLVKAEYVDGLIVNGNTYEKTTTYPQSDKNTETIEVKDCINVKIFPPSAPARR